MFCTHCGCAQPEGARFCRSCGKPLACAPAAPAAPVSAPEPSVTPAPIPAPIPGPIPEPIPEPIPAPAPEAIPEPIPAPAPAAYAPPQPPVYTPPAPVYTPPAPVYTPPAPVYTPPAPVYTPPAYTPPAPEPPARKKRRWPLLLAALLLVLAIAAAAVYWFFLRPSPVPEDYLSLANDFAGAVLLGDAEEIEALAHEDMADAMVDSYCGAYTASSLRYSLVKEETAEELDLSLLQYLLEEDFGLDLEAQAGRILYYSGTMEADHTSYRFTLRVSLVCLEGQWYPLLAELTELASQ